MAGVRDVIPKLGETRFQRIAATVEIVAAAVVFVAGMSILADGLPAFGDWPQWIKFALGLVMTGGACAALERWIKRLWPKRGER
jgi:hypothetical protein